MQQFNITLTIRGKQHVCRVLASNVEDAAREAVKFCVTGISIDEIECPADPTLVPKNHWKVGQEYMKLLNDFAVNNQPQTTNN